MQKKFIETIEQIKISFPQWLIGITAILLIRFLFEAISSPPPQTIGIDPDRLVHHYLFFMTLGLLLGLCVSLFIPQKRKEIFNWVMFGMLITWLPPIFDLIISRGSGMNYICAMPRAVFFSYLTFFGPLTTPGITLGMRIEVLVLLIGIFYYTKLNTQNLLRAILAVFICYTIIFIYFAYPSLVAYGIFKFPDFLKISVEEVFKFSISHISLIISYTFYVLLFIITGLWFYQTAPQKFIAVLKNSRWLRLTHYWLMAFAGAIFAIHLTKPDTQTLWLGIISIKSLFFAIYAAWMFSVGTNDIVDIEIDKISSPQRPLITGALTIEDVRFANIFFLVSALIGAYLAGPEAFYFTITFIIAYYIYSSPPLRLKRIPIFSSFLVGIATLTIFMAGFFAFSADRRMQALPLEYIALILLIFTLASNIRDMKDIDADRAAGILTLPVIFGENKGARIIGILLSLSFLLVPMFLRLVSLILLAIPFAIVAYLSVVKKPFREWRIFALYFAYAILALVLILQN